MRAKLMSLALAALIVAVPVPASQLLAGTFSPPSSVPRIVPGTENLATLLADPQAPVALRFTPVARLNDLAGGL